MGGGSSTASTAWDRYVPTPPPGSDRNEGQSVQLAAGDRNNEPETQLAKTDRNSGNGAKTETSDRSEGRAKQQTKSDKNNKSVSQKDETEGKLNRHGKAQIKSDVDRKSNGAEHKMQASYDEDSKKEKEYVHAQFLGEVNERSPIHNTSSGSRWKMKIIPSKQFAEQSYVLGNRPNNVSKSEQFSDKNAHANDESFPTGPVTKPRMKIGYEYMLEKPSHCQFSPNGDFVLDSRTGVEYVT